MPDNTTTIQSFLNVFAAPIAAGNVTAAINTVMALFSPDAGNPVTSPTVGIGGNTQATPVTPLNQLQMFTGGTAIRALFTELLSSFPSLTFTAYPDPNNPVFCV
jgi:hypothetical protein